MDDHFDIGRVFEIGKFDITRLTCICMMPASTYFKHTYFAFPVGGKLSTHN